VRNCADAVRYSKLVAILVGAAFGGASCGGKSLTPTTSDAGVPDASVSNPDAGALSHDAGRVPKEHRVSRTPCSTERGAVTPTSDGCPVDAGRCAQDSDCAAGRNGRCEDVGLCPSDCSYDDCFQDSDCANQKPCGCRLSAIDMNRCYPTSNCNIDSDCGDGGYCSPSLVDRGCICSSGTCTAGYFCHTERDGCLDERDCPNAAPCAFDQVEQRFVCQECLPRP
jgi:hypothetical protein